MAKNQQQRVFPETKPSSLDTQQISLSAFELKYLSTEGSTFISRPYKNFRGSYFFISRPYKKLLTAAEISKSGKIKTQTIWMARFH